MEMNKTNFETKQLCEKRGEIPARYILAVLMFVGMNIGFSLRVCLNVAILEMVNNSETQNINRTENSESCAELLTVGWNNSITVSQNVQNKGHFDWDIETQSIILGTFYYGFVISLIPGSYLVQRFGAKWFFGLSVFLSAIINVLIPTTSEFGIIPLLVLEVIHGLCQGISFPAMNILISQWTPTVERSTTFAFITSGMPFGITIGMSLSGVLCDSNFLGGWPSVFYVFGAVGCLWFAFWAFLIHETPADHPRISDSELKFIHEHQVISRNELSAVPWKAILSSGPVWALVFPNFGQLWGLYLLTTEMPTFMSTILKYDIKTNGILSSLPYILQGTMALISGYIADKLRRSGKLEIDTIRKLFTSLGMLSPGACILWLAFVGCRRVISVALFCIAMALNGLVFAGNLVTTIDLSPTYSGAIIGFLYTSGNIAGFLAPYTVGEITRSGQTVENWKWVFITTAVIYFFTTVVFDVFGSAKRQPWDGQVSAERQTNTNPGFISEEPLSTTDGCGKITNF